MSDDTASTSPLALTVGRDGDDDHSRRVAAVTCYTLNVTRLVVQEGDTVEGRNFIAFFLFLFIFIEHKYLPSAAGWRVFSF